MEFKKLYSFVLAAVMSASLAPLAQSNPTSLKGYEPGSIGGVEQGSPFTPPREVPHKPDPRYKPPVGKPPHQKRGAPEDDGPDRFSRNPQDKKPWGHPGQGGHEYHGRRPPPSKRDGSGSQDDHPKRGGPRYPPGEGPGSHHGHNRGKVPPYNPPHIRGGGLDAINWPVKRHTITPATPGGATTPGSNNNNEDKKGEPAPTTGPHRPDSLYTVSTKTAPYKSDPTKTESYKSNPYKNEPNPIDPFKNPPDAAEGGSRGHGSGCDDDPHSREKGHDGNHEGGNSPIGPVSARSDHGSGSGKGPGGHGQHGGKDDGSKKCEAYGKPGGGGQKPGGPGPILPGVEEAQSQGVSSQ